MINSSPTKGLRFYHSRVLDSMRMHEGKFPQLYEVTRVTKWRIYYRAVIDFGTRQTLGSPECCEPSTFSRICKQVFPNGERH